jgi:predicted AAA+ superfamily ATPase
MKNDMQSKEKLKILLTRWYEFKPPRIVQRDFNYSLLESKFILSIVGVRRCGKTFLLYQIMQKLEVPRENIVYINFEDEALYPLAGDELQNLLEVYFELFNPNPNYKIYLLLDEIQNIPYWEKWVRRVYDTEKDFKIIITGSTSKLTSKEIATALRGRTITFNLHPFSFKEFLRAKNFKFDPRTITYSKKRPILARLLNEYLKYGGFPEVVFEEEGNKSMVLQEYYRAIFYRDVVERYSIRNIKLLEAFLKLTTSSTSRLISFSKAEDFLKTLGFKVSKATLIEYMSYFTSCFLCFEVPIFSYKIKDQLQYPRKVYSIDPGLVNAVTLKFSTEMGRVYENIVFLELQRRGEEEVYYWKNKYGREVDFIIKRELKPNQLIQVCFNIKEAKVKEREIKALIYALEEFRLKQGLIITDDYDAEEKIDNKRIKFVSLWRWLLEL